MPKPAAADTTAPDQRPPKQYAIIIDALLVLVFATIGRATHGESIAPVQVASTAWPFITALLVAWAVMLIRKRPHLGVGAGLFVWFTTWVGGLALRVTGGDTAATAFIIVAGVVLLVFLVGWRAIALVLDRRTSVAHE
ncbi:DUF3054 domain-containing protein [Propionibacteriaceae bacterium G1746]|uniref:DUF3054 domain-containing protein n=1 Tax=Aestuariimicrobium sp. G57 TaxID=3418485 RepID=UPI003C1B2B53